MLRSSSIRRFVAFSAATCSTLYVSSISALILTSSTSCALRISVSHAAKGFLPLFSSQRTAQRANSARRAYLRGGSMSSMPENSSVKSENGVNQKADQSAEMEIDAEYPGTAVQRLRSVHARVAQLTRAQLDADWPSVRRTLLWAGTFLGRMIYIYRF